MGFTSPPWVNHSTFSEHFISLKCSSLLALYLYATEEDILVLRMKWKVPLSVNMDGSRSPFHCSLSPLGARSAPAPRREFTNREASRSSQSPCLPPRGHDILPSVYWNERLTVKDIKAAGKPNRRRGRTQQTFLFVYLACTASDT